MTKDEAKQARNGYILKAFLSLAKEFAWHLLKDMEVTERF